MHPNPVIRICIKALEFNRLCSKGSLSAPICVSHPACGDSFISCAKYNLVKMLSRLLFLPTIRSRLLPPASG